MSAARGSGRLNGQIVQEATDWLIRFSEREVDAAGRAEFHRWLCTSPEHVRAYLRVSAFWRDADRIGAGSNRQDIDALVRLAKFEADVIALNPIPEIRPQPDARRPVRMRRFRSFAVAASLCLVCAVAVIAWYVQSRGSVYVTGVGEQRTVTLPDGSMVIINAGSSLRLAFTDTERSVELREGQALFKVAKNPAWPFIVYSGDARVRAVGTEFDVNHRATDTVVTVIEGKVAVMPGDERPSGSVIPSLLSGRTVPDAVRLGSSVPPADRVMLLAAGEQAWVTPRVARRHTLSQVQSATAWTQGLLVFDGATLSEVAREFNRHNLKPLIVADDSLSKLRVSGTFPAVGAERIVRFLQERFHVTVYQTSDAIRISNPDTALPDAAL